MFSCFYDSWCNKFVMHCTGKITMTQLTFVKSIIRLMKPASKTTEEKTTSILICHMSLKKKKLNCLKHVHPHIHFLPTGNIQNAVAHN